MVDLAMEVPRPLAQAEVPHLKAALLCGADQPIL
jgi:hypothetical protein